MARCICGELLPHYCPATASGPGYPGPDPGGPDFTAPPDWIADMTGRPGIPGGDQ